MRKLILILFILISNSCFSQSSSEFLDKIITEYFQRKEFIGSVLIAKDNEILLKKGYGYSDIQNKLPNTPSTNYCIASITKLFTLSSILLLNENGLLKMDDPISKYLDSFPNGDKILIKHLTSNQSGLVDYINEAQYEVTNEKIGIDSLIKVFKNLPPNFQPGEKYSYCNSGWVLLALIIEKVSGMSFSDFVKKNIFNNADMTSSFSDWDYSSIDLAKGYHKVKGSFKPNPPFNSSQIIGSGNIVSTVEDLYSWYNKIYKNEKDCMKFQFRFNGAFGGYRAILFINRTSNCIYILLSNYGYAPLDEMVDKLDECLTKQSHPNSVLNLNKMTGYFYAGDSHYMVVEKKHDYIEVYTSSIGQTVEKMSLLPVSESRLIGANISFDFADYNTNQYNLINATWGCNTYPYKRANYSFDEKKANSYTGDYLLDNGKIVKIRFKSNDWLILQIEGSSGHYQKSKARGANSKNFIYLHGRLIFENSDNSKYQSIKINLNGKDVTGSRINNNAP